MLQRQVSGAWPERKALDIAGQKPDRDKARACRRDNEQEDDIPALIGCLGTHPGHRRVGARNRCPGQTKISQRTGIPTEKQPRMRRHPRLERE